MNYFKKYDRITGWLVFAIAAAVYLLTMEPTASLWDCAEFIATSYKLEVGHPPGAPLFMMISRFFTLFAPGAEYAAVMVNTMSSLASAFTILFLFWSITHLGRRITANRGQELTPARTWTILGAGIVGALAYAFTDTFWFSAIEGEVYALSSFFTAVVVWAILKWEEVADEPHANRWLVLIAYLMGLSIGVHLLNLLAIPAIVFIYYFKKTPKVTAWGVVKATLIAAAILLFINNIVIPYTVAAGAVVDRWFVNGLGLPVNSGLLTFVLLLITLVNAGFADTATYALLSGVADAAFFFMPIFVAYGAAKKLGGTPIYSMICAAALLHGKYTALVAAGEPITLLGIPVRLMSYSSSLLPALLIALCAYYLEKFFNKIVPGIFKSLLVGLCTVTVTSILGFTVLAPLGGYLGNYLAVAFSFLGDKIGFITVGLLAACLPWLVMTGMHIGLVPFMAQALTNPGYDAVFRPAFILHNMAEGGACIGVALRTKSAEKRAEALSIAFGCIVAGVTEPAIYGINLPRKKPMYGVMAGGAVGGVVAGLLGAKAYVMGYSTVLALPIFQDTIIAMSIAIVTAIVVAAIVTYVLGFEE